MKFPIFFNTRMIVFEMKSRIPLKRHPATITFKDRYETKTTNNSLTIDMSTALARLTIDMSSFT